MTDPEILDPEGPGPRASGPSSAPGGTPGASAVEHVVARVQKALPGRMVKVDVEVTTVQTPAGPISQPRFRVEATGKGGPLVVESGPFQTVLVRFGGARFTFLMAPDEDKAAEQIAERVRSLAAEEIVVLEEQATPRLKRSTVLAVKGGRFEAVLDSGLEPGVVDGESPRLSSFEGTYSRAPGRDEVRRIDKLQGGLIGRLKRKVAEKILEKAASTVMGQVEKAAARDEAAAGPRPDAGHRTLKG